MTHIHNYNVPHRIVTIAEDATPDIARVDYDNETDCCIGFVLLIDKHGLPKTDSFLATSFSSIEKCLLNSLWQSMLMCIWHSQCIKMFLHFVCHVWGITTNLQHRKCCLDGSTLLMSVQQGT